MRKLLVLLLVLSMILNAIRCNSLSKYDNLNPALAPKCQMLHAQLKAKLALKNSAKAPPDIVFRTNKAEDYCKKNASAFICYLCYSYLRIHNLF